MTMTRKIGLFAVLAMAVAAFAIPSMASATLSNWKDKGVNLTSNANIPMTGNFSFTGAIGGTTCEEVHTNLLLEPGSTGKITSFTLTLPKCKGTGSYAGCTITGIHVQKLPWVTHNTTTHVTVTGMEITFTKIGFLCPTTTTLKSIAGNDVKLTPDNAVAIKKFTLGGQMSSSVGGNVTVTGLFTPSNAADLGTYGL